MTRQREDRRLNRSTEPALGALGHALIAAGYPPNTKNAAPTGPQRHATVTSPRSTELAQKPDVTAKRAVESRNPPVAKVEPAKASKKPPKVRNAKSRQKIRPQKNSKADLTHMAPSQTAASEFAKRPPPSQSAEATTARDTTIDARRRRIEDRVSGLGAAFAKRESAAAHDVHIDDDARDAVRLRLAAAIAPPRSGDIVEIVLGIDFGTTSTKVVARRPYDTGSPAAAMPTPVFSQPEDNPHLWASRLWRTTDGRLTLTPEDGAQPICAIKTRLMETEAPDALAHAAAFLGQIIAHARGWLINERRDFIGQRRPEWRHHFGFPAASLEDEALADRYRKVASAALRLAKLGRAPTETEARDALDAAIPCATTMAEAGILLFPEVAGATAAFATSRELSGNLNVMVDIGGGTVDVCTFNVHSCGDDKKMPIFEAAVDLLGVESWRLCEGDRHAEEDFAKCLNAHLRRVIWETKTHHAALSPCWQEGLPVLVVGGGVRSGRHVKCIANLPFWLRNPQQACPGGATIIRAPAPDSFQHDAGQDGAHRLSVALGLSLPDENIPVVQQGIAPVFHFRRTDDQDTRIGPEQM